MPAAFRIEPLDNRQIGIASELHRVLLLASAQESALLELSSAPPSQRSIEQIQAAGDYFIGAHDDQGLCGWLGLCADDEANQIHIASLVVEPRRQRQGIGRLLVIEALRRANGFVVSVTTPALNAPALALYKGLGFAEYRRGKLGAAELEVLKLRSASAA